MKAIALLAALSMPVLTGCGGARELTTLPPNCPNATALALEYGPGRIVLNAECITVNEGTTVRMTISPAEAGKVRTKNRGNGWLNRRNDQTPREIQFPVPRKHPGNVFEEYKFEIHVEDVGMLDPRIVIQ
jgi:hypothetical protein